MRHLQASVFAKFADLRILIFFLGCGHDITFFRKALCVFFRPLNMQERAGQSERYLAFTSILAQISVFHLRSQVLAILHRPSRCRTISKHKRFDRKKSMQL
jgi:hypothetical protein